MKDEEMAEQFADNISGLELTCSLLSAKDKNHAYRLGRYDGFLAGLKAGRPQWHNLRIDPNDLPKEDCQVITVGKSPRGLLIKKVAHYLRSEKKFAIWNKEYENFTNLYNVIAWCEIPTFDKE